MPQDLHSCSWFCEQPLCVLAQRDELRDRMAELERDAARYRWLRGPDRIEVAYLINKSDADLDAAIDAAMEGK